MASQPLWRPVRLAATVALALTPALGQAASDTDVRKLLERLNQRLDKLEQRNAELEAELKAARAAPVSAVAGSAAATKGQTRASTASVSSTQPGLAGQAPAPVSLEERVKSLEEQNAKVAAGLSREDVSENEPDLTARLKAVEYQSLGMLKQARMAEALEGITAGMSLSTVAQRPGNGSGPNGTDLYGQSNNSQLNYRGDVYVTLPLDNIGDIESRIFAQFRFGQGFGLNNLYSFSKPNATAFRVTGLNPDDSVAILGQAWYQATIPLPYGGFKPHSKESLEVTFGKMDPFVFFDQNAAANDETKQFLNTAFVHNPLLDAGGDIGVDANGFAPGFRMSYANSVNKREVWRLSAGVFGAGRGANYSRFFSSPLLIAQAETQQRFFGGLLGNYRLYYWRNGQAPTFEDGSAKRSGWGISVDQRVGDTVTLFGRYGQLVQNTGARFDRALTLGAEINGSNWNRGGDSLGIGLGMMRAANDFRSVSSLIDVDGNGVPDYGFAAKGSERLVEVYYRYRINKQFELSPDLQYIARPAGNADSKAITLMGLRAQLTY